MRLAEHLAVLDIRSATLAPSRHMVCIYVLQIPYLRVVGIVADGAERTVALALLRWQHCSTTYRASLLMM